MMVAACVNEPACIRASWSARVPPSVGGIAGGAGTPSRLQVHDGPHVQPPDRPSASWVPEQQLERPVSFFWEQQLDDDLCLW